VIEDWGVWVVYGYDINEQVEAIFPDEIDALRHAVGRSMYVKRIGRGEVRPQLKGDK
jgi:hypothetical protein